MLHNIFRLLQFKSMQRNPSMWPVRLKLFSSFFRLFCVLFCLFRLFWQNENGIFLYMVWRIFRYEHYLRLTNSFWSSGFILSSYIIICLISKVLVIRSSSAESKCCKNIFLHYICVWGASKNFAICSCTQELEIQPTPARGGHSLV